MYYSKFDRQILNQKIFMPTNQQYMNNSISFRLFFKALKLSQDEIEERRACQLQFTIFIRSKRISKFVCVCQ